MLYAETPHGWGWHAARSRSLDCTPSEPRALNFSEEREPMATLHTHPQFGAIPIRGAAGEPARVSQEPAADAMGPPAEQSASSTRTKRWLERMAERVGRSKLQLLSKQRKAVVAELRRIPDRMQKITNQARLVLELSDDFRSGAYRSISWVSIAIAAGCLVYAVSPSDIVPDAIPGLGAIDDMIVLTLAMRFLERDLRAYCRHKGYDEHDYFDVRK
jgi:uncharacterized membrane protein YkvA (DUF1232 family)